jgi:hypothetical protein
LSQCDAFVALTGKAFDVLLGQFISRANPSGLNNLLTTIASKAKNGNLSQCDAFVALAAAGLGELLEMFSEGTPTGLNNLLTVVVNKKGNSAQYNAFIALAKANINALLGLFEDSENPAGLDELLELIAGEDREEARGRVAARLGKGDNPTIDALIEIAKGAKGKAAPPAAVKPPKPAKGAKGKAAPAPGSPAPAAPTPEPPPPTEPSVSAKSPEAEATRLAREMFAAGKKPEEIKAGIKDLLLNEGYFMEDTDLDELLKNERLHMDSYSTERIESINASVRALWEANGRKEVSISGNGLNCGFYSMLSQVDPELKGDQLSPEGAGIKQAQPKVDALRIEVRESYKSELEELEKTPKEKQDKAWQDRHQKCQDQISYMENSPDHFMLDTEMIQWFANKYKRNFVTFSQDNSKGVLRSVQINIADGKEFPSIDIETDSGKKIEEYVQTLSPWDDIKTNEYLKGLKEAYEAIAGAYGLNLKEATMGDILAALIKDQNAVCLIKKPNHFDSLQHSSQIGGKIPTNLNAAEK